MILEGGHSCSCFSNVFFISMSSTSHSLTSDIWSQTTDIKVGGRLRICIVISISDLHVAFMTYIHDIMKLFKCRDGGQMFSWGQVKGDWTWWLCSAKREKEADTRDMMLISCTWESFLTLMKVRISLSSSVSRNPELSIWTKRACVCH